MRNWIWFLIVLPTIIYSQSSSDGIDVSLEFLGTKAGESDITKVQVNDTLIFALEINDLSTYDVTYIHTDVEYNKNAYTYLGLNWKFPNASNSAFSFTDTKWSPNSNYDDNDLWGQWSGGGGSYNAVTGWDVWHYTTQDVNSFSGDYVEMEFIAKTTDNANYDKAINITMAKVDDNNQSYTHPVGKVRAHPTQYISNVPLEDFDNNVYLKVEFSTNVDPTKVKVDISKGDNFEYITTVVLDASGEANVTDYLNNSNVNYNLNFRWNGTEEEWQQLKDNAITISDAVLALKEVGGFDHGNAGNAYDYGIQYLATDFGVNGSIDSQDSYDLLAHVLGVHDVFVKYIEDKFESGMAVVPTSIYNGITFSTWSDNGLPDVGDGSFNVDLSNGDITLNYKSALWADANLSHGTAPDAQSTTSARMMQPMQSYSTKVFSDETIDAEFITEVVNGGIEAEIKILSSNTAALQLTLDYDNSRLRFTEVVFDTGNTTTNFGNETNGRVNVGSINQNGGVIPQGSSYRIKFEGDVSSAAGLVTIVNTDAANKEGVQQILRLQ